MPAPIRPPAAPSPGVRRPAPGRPASAPPPASGGGGGFLNLLMVGMVVMFSFLYYLAFQGDALDADIPAAGSQVPNAKSLLAIGLSSGKNLTITEAEINGYIAATLKTKQGGPLSGSATIERVAIRLKDGEFQVVVARKLFGRSHTVAVHMTPTQIGQGENLTWSVQPTGGKVGKLPVAGGLLQLVLAPVYQLSKAYAEELKILRYASSIRLEEGRVLLGPVIVRVRE